MSAPSPSALSRAMPQLATRLPSIALGDWPTPVRRAKHLGQRLGLDLWIKHDDRSARPYGGNKVRKLELILAAAQQADAARLLTVGGIGSNHVLATALHGAAQGLGCSAVVFPQPLTPEVRQNVARMAAAGVELLPCQGRDRVPLALLLARHKVKGSFFVDPGGSSPLGTVGYVCAAFELAAQIRRGELPPPDEIVVPLGSGGTVAGLLLGLGMAGLRPKVVAVRVVERLICNRALTLALLARTAALLKRLGQPLKPPAPFAIEHGFAGRCYGEPTAAARHACEVALNLEGLELESTYSGKAMAALMARYGAARPGAGRVLFWHTYAGSSGHEAAEIKDFSSLPPRVVQWLADPDA